MTLFESLFQYYTFNITVSSYASLNYIGISSLSAFPLVIGIFLASLYFMTLFRDDVLLIKTTIENRLGVVISLIIGYLLIGTISSLSEWYILDVSSALSSDVLNTSCVFLQEFSPIAEQAVSILNFQYVILSVSILIYILPIIALLIKSNSLVLFMVDVIFLHSTLFLVLLPYLCVSLEDISEEVSEDRYSSNIA